MPPWVEFPGLIVERPVGDPWAADSWLAVRDPSGDLRRQLEANGALADGTIGFADVAAAPVLRPQGAGEPGHARRHAGLLPRVAARCRLGRLPGRLPEGGGEGLTHPDRRRSSAAGRLRGGCLDVDDPGIMERGVDDRPVL